MIVLQFATERGFSSSLIRLGTWSEFSHVDFVVPDGYKIKNLAQERRVVGERWLGARLRGGVSSRFPGYAPFTRTFRLRVDAPDSVLDWAWRERGKPYDWRAVVGFAFRRDWREEGSWFCSEFIAAAFRAAGWPLLRADHLNRVSPADLLMSPFLKPV